MCWRPLLKNMQKKNVSKWNFKDLKEIFFNHFVSMYV